MTKYIGRRVQLGVGRETTRGAGAAPLYQVPGVTFDFDDKVVKAESAAGLGRIEDSEERFVTTRYGEGALEGEIRANSFGLFLYAMLATASAGYSVAGPTDSAYTHSFTLQTSNQHQSLSFLVVDPNTTELYKLVMLNELEIRVELDEVVKFTATFLGKQATDVYSGSLSMPALVDDYKFTKKHLSFKVAADLEGLSEATAISLKSLTFRVSKNVVLDDVLGTAEPEDILNRQISVEGEITLSYEDETWKNYMKVPTDRAMEIKLENTDELIGAATRPSLTIQMPKVDFFDWVPDYSLDEPVIQRVSFKAHYNTANLEAIITTCDLVNTEDTY